MHNKKLHKIKSAVTQPVIFSTNKIAFSLTDWHSYTGVLYKAYIENKRSVQIGSHLSTIYVKFA